MNIGISDDYAILSGNGFKFYYGYEETDQDGNWLFVGQFGVYKNTYLPSDLGAEQWDNPEEILLKGIGLFLETMKQNAKT